MGRELLIKEVGGDRKYKIYSTTVDEFTTDEFLTRQEVLREVARDRITKVKLDLIREYFIFPHHWARHGADGVHNVPQHLIIQALDEADKVIKEGYQAKDFDAFVDKKFQKLFGEI